MHSYYIVIGAFVANLCGVSDLCHSQPQKYFSSMPAIDEASILVHIGQGSSF